MQNLFENRFHPVYKEYSLLQIDRDQISNLDCFIEAVNYNFDTSCSLLQFVNGFKKVSSVGIKVEFKDNFERIFATFFPTLSSLNFIKKIKMEKNSLLIDSGHMQNCEISFNENLKHFNRKWLFDQLKDLLLDNQQRLPVKETVDLFRSWFSILWTCSRTTQIAGA